MPIPPPYRDRFAYHFTHLDNLPGILSHGLYSPNEQRRLGIAHKSIAIQGIQNRRATMVVPCDPGGVVHDYVPFYLCARSSMLLSLVNAKNVDQLFLIYLAIPITVVERSDVVFTNASANTGIPPTFYNDPSDLSTLDWSSINSKKWAMPTEQQKQARMAEVLVHTRVDISQIHHITVWNDEVKKAVEQMFADAGSHCPPIWFDGHDGNHHYFTSFYSGSRTSIVTGPHFTKLAYENAVKQILESGQNPHARFKNIAEMLAALQNEFGVLPETAELIGLESENEIHTEDVGRHTLSVVQELVNSREFAALNDPDKRLAELAAYLHDIGKGPKARWASKGGKQQVDPDHPIGSVQMLCRILTQEITTIKARSVRVLAKLICYHDLVGDILGKGRNPEQLEDIARTEREFDMLIALGLADMRAVNPNWDAVNAPKIPALRERVRAKINTTSPEEGG